MFETPLAAAIFTPASRLSTGVELDIERELALGRVLPEALEGELAVDVLATGAEVVVVAALAGTSPQDLELHLTNDVLTIRGRRATPVPEAAEYFYQECFWGPFSRTIVLPAEVKAELARAEYKNGILKISLPKTTTTAHIPILIIAE